MKDYRSFIWVFVLLLLFAAGIFSGCEKDKAFEPSGKTVKIGVVAPLSGPLEKWGENGILGIRTMLKVWPYLANGDRPEIIAEDDGNDPGRTLKAIEKLVHEDNVAAILVFSSSKAFLPAVAYVDRLKTPVLVLLATHPDIAGSPWLNQLIFDDEMQGKVAALYVRDELLKNSVAVFRDREDPHSSNLADVFSREFLETGGRVERFDVEESRVGYEEIVKKLQSSGIEFLYLPLGAGDVLEIEQAAAALGWNPGIMVGDGLLAQFLLQYDDQLDLTEGMLATELYSSELHESPYGKKAVQVFKEYFQARGTSFAASGFEGMAVVMIAMNRCGVSDDKECLQKTLRRDEGFTGLMSRIRIGLDGKAERPIFINAIRDERLVPVVKVN